jgi:hypothetical protein
MATPESSTRDKNYNLVTVTQLCLEHVWRLEQYAHDTLIERMTQSSLVFSDVCKSTAVAVERNARLC